MPYLYHRSVTAVPPYCHNHAIMLTQLCQCSGTSLLIGRPYKASISLSHMAELASLGILQSPLGLIEILPTLGPSGKQERLNC